MLSHELQQSLRSVLLPAELLGRRLRGQIGPEEAELLEQTVSNGRRMNELIEGVLSFSRAEREQCELSDISAADALRASVDELQLALAESAAKLEFADLPEVRGNQVSLARVFCNLIVNAIKYRGPHPPHIPTFT
jgi:light-regulated signal transduction histidine kinase (bacteriophytochrome)